jgi:DNA-binding transcriptional LysR family regulator
VVSAPTAFGILQLGCVLPAFLAAHPGVTLDIRLDDRFVNLVAEGFDLAIRIGRLADSTLVARKLAPSRQVIVASPAYLKARGTPRSPEELSGHNCFVYTLTPNGNVWRLAKGSEDVRVPVTGNLRLNNGLLERDAAERGAGVAMLPTFYVGPLIAARKLLFASFACSAALRASCASSMRSRARRLCSKSAEPASVSASRRVVRCRSRAPRRASSRVRYLLTTALESSSSSAAFVKLPFSTTFTNTAMSARLSTGVSRLVHDREQSYRTCRLDPAGPGPHHSFHAQFAPDNRTERKESP